MAAHIKFPPLFGLGCGLGVLRVTWCSYLTPFSHSIERLSGKNFYMFSFWFFFAISGLIHTQRTTVANEEDCTCPVALREARLDGNKHELVRRPTTAVLPKSQSDRKERELTLEHSSTNIQDPSKGLVCNATVSFAAARHYFDIPLTVFTIIAFGFYFGCCLESILNSIAQESRFLLPCQLHIILLIIFHSTEFLFVRQFHPDYCTWSAFLLNNGHQYTLCVLGSAIESYLWSTACTSGWNYLHPLLRSLPEKIYIRAAGRFFLKALACSRLIGLLISSLGLALRGAALLSARSNFTHTIAKVDRPGFVLVTSGSYRFCRHPAYLGWYMWAIGRLSRLQLR